MIRTKSCPCVMLRVTSLWIRLTILETYNYFPLNIHIELSPPLSSNIHIDRTFIGRNMMQWAAHVCIVIIRISKRSVLKRICVQDCICCSILILFWQLNLFRFIQNNSYCNNLTLYYRCLDLWKLNHILTFLCMCLIIRLMLWTNKTKIICLAIVGRNMMQCAAYL